MCGLAVVSGKFTWWMLFSLPAYKLATHIGYGSEGRGTAFKIYRRALWSVIRTAAGLTFLGFTGAWMVYAAQVAVGLVVSVLFGVLNPVKAPQEEGIINFTNCFLVPAGVI